MGDAKQPNQPEQAAPRSGSRRQRRRAGAPAKNFAQSRSAKTARTVRYHDESPEDARDFDVDYWIKQRPPHWG